MAILKTKGTVPKIEHGGRGRERGHARAVVDPQVERIPQRVEELRADAGLDRESLVPFFFCAGIRSATQIRALAALAT